MSKKQPPKKLKKETEKQPPRKTYQFRIYPTSKQINVLETWLGLCCDTYNAALDERKSAYRMAGLSLSYALNVPNCPNAKRCAPS